MSSNEDTFVCVCVKERECVRAWVVFSEDLSPCVCVRERERMYACMWLCVWERERVCVWVLHSEKERDLSSCVYVLCVYEWDRQRERERVCVCVCKTENYPFSNTRSPSRTSGLVLFNVLMSYPNWNPNWTQSYKTGVARLFYSRANFEYNFSSGAAYFCKAEIFFSLLMLIEKH